MNAVPDMTATSAMLADRITDLIVLLTEMEPTNKSGDRWRFRSKGSLSVAIAGRRRGQWYDFEAGQGGDALALVAHLRGIPLRDAWAWALSWLGSAADYPAVRRPPGVLERKDTSPQARRLWMERQEAAGTIVEVYLASRGLRLPASAPLGFHPRCYHDDTGKRMPAMLALMTDPLTGVEAGVHRTYLRPDGSGKIDGIAKKFLGRAGVIRLVPEDEIGAGLGIAEGIETALSATQLIGWGPVWACGSAGGIARFPVLDTIETLTIFADADDGGASVKAARQLARKWTEAGREVQISIPPDGTDWNDAARWVAT